MSLGVQMHWLVRGGCCKNYLNKFLKTTLCFVLED